MERVCSNCEGTGEVIVAYGSTPVYGTCTDCRGTGTEVVDNKDVYYRYREDI